ncbi:MAG: hypothetical protein LBR94_04035, partial [Desulfovibrio sp.]|jgi:hypothetical protein|nr:hypothetical protein [Desulfovibrio sp.]
LRDALESLDIGATRDALARLQALPLTEEKARAVVSELADLILAAEFRKAADAVNALLKRRDADGK